MLQSSQPKDHLMVLPFPVCMCASKLAQSTRESHQCLRKHPSEMKRTKAAQRNLPHSLRERMWERFYLHPHTGDKISTVRKPVSDRQFHMCILMKQWCLETQCMHTVKIEPKLSGERKITNSNGRLCTHSGFSFGANVLKSSETEFIYLISTCVYRLRVWSTVSSLITLHLVE